MCKGFLWVFPGIDKPGVVKEAAFEGMLHMKTSGESLRVCMDKTVMC
jgi:hypothetical protein